MEDEDDLSVWNEFINNEFEVENKDTFINDNYLNKSSREESFKKKKGLPPPGTLTKKIVIFPNDVIPWRCHSEVPLFKQLLLKSS